MHVMETAGKRRLSLPQRQQRGEQWGQQLQAIPGLISWDPPKARVPHDAPHYTLRGCSSPVRRKADILGWVGRPFPVSLGPSSQACDQFFFPVPCTPAMSPCLSVPKHRALYFLAFSRLFPARTRQETWLQMMKANSH